MYTAFQVSQRVAAAEQDHPAACQVKFCARFVNYYRASTKCWLRSLRFCLHSVRSNARKELRCLTRKDLVETLAKNLPAGTIRFGCRVAAVDEDSGSRCPVLTTEDGHTIKAKVIN